MRWLTLIVARCMGAHVARRSRFPTAGYHRCHGNAIKDPLNLYRGTGVIGVSVDPSDYQNYDIVLARMEFAGAEIFEFFLSPIHLPISDSSHSPFVGTFSDNSYVVLSWKFVQVPIFILRGGIIPRRGRLHRIRRWIIQSIAVFRMEIIERTF